MNKQNYDVIIIGSGLGGLSCGATLAKNGKKVLVLEQHELIGGCATCFKRKGMLIDAGLHEMDFGSEKTDMKHIVFKKLGLFEKITLVPLPSAWSVKVLDSKSGGADFDEANSNKAKTQDFLIPHKSTKEALISYLTKKKKGLEKYFKKLNFQARLNYKFPFEMGFLEFFFAPLHTLFFLTLSAIRQRKVGDMLNKLIKDSKLKKILNINMAYYHCDAWRFNWNFHAIAQANYYHQGVYIKGGSQSLSDALAEIIKENGGEVRARCDVKKILLADKKAVGVAFVDNTNSDSKAKGVQELFAEKIVANCDPRIVYEELLDSKVSRADSKLTQNFTAKTSLLSVYMVFDTNLSKKFKDMDYSTFCIDKEYFDKPFDREGENMLAQDIEKRGFVFVNYSKIDSGLSEREDRYFGVITALSSYEEWENLSKEEYKAKKERAKKAFESRLEAFFPGIMEHCIHSEFATPKTIERYTRAKKGVPYGWDQDLEGFFARSRFKSKSVKNLYFASAFGFPGGGFTGALLSGYRTARKMLDPYFYPRQLGLCVLFGVVASTLVIEGIKLLLG